MRILAVLVLLSMNWACRTCPVPPPKIVTVTKVVPCLTRPLPEWVAFRGDVPGKDSGCPSVYGICFRPRAAAAVLLNLKAYREWSADAWRDCQIADSRD